MSICFLSSCGDGGSGVDPALTVPPADDVSIVPGDQQVDSEWGTDDTGTDDTGTDDTGTDDTGTDDSGTDDSGTDDSGTDDSGTDDSGTDDSGTDDSGTGDTGTGEEQLSTLQELFPSRYFLFGQDINEIPGPSLVTTDGKLALWFYLLQDNQLTNASFEPLFSHRLAWQRFVELVPDEYLKSIYEVQFEADEFEYTGSIFRVTSYLTDVPGEEETRITMTEKFPSLFYEAHLDNEPPHSYYNTDVFIHETGHLVANTQLIASGGAESTYSLGPWHVRLDSPIRSYLEQFWEGEVYQYWLDSAGASNLAALVRNRFPDHFVSRYAATNFTEDFAESFQQFVLEDSMPDSGDYAGADKIIWFWNQPDYVLTREEIRASI